MIGTISTFDDAFCKDADIEAGLLNEGYVIAEGNGISKENMTRTYIQISV